MELLGVFTLIGTLIQGEVINKIATISGALAVWVNGLLMSAVTIWVMINGFAAMRGELQSPINTIVWRATKMMLIFGVGLTGYYMSDIVPMIYQLASQLMNVFATSQGGNCSASLAGDPIGAYKSMDCAAQTAAKTIYAFLQAGIENAKLASLYDVSTWLGCLQYLLMALIIAIGTLILFVLLGFEFVSAQISLTIFLCLGPLAIACLAFEPTKKYFEGWLSKIVYVTIVQAMIVLYLGMATSILTIFTKKAIGDVSADLESAIQNLAAAPAQIVGISVAFLILYGILGFIALRIPALAGGLVGHTGQSSGLGQAASQQAMNMATKGLTKLMSKIGGKGKGGGGTMTGS